MPFVLNARTDAFLKAGDRDPAEVLAEAVERGRAYLDAGASTFFAPGKLDEAQVSTLVEALGPQKLNLIAIPGALPLARMQELGVARSSFGPWSQNVALTALAQLAESAYAGGAPARGHAQAQLTALVPPACCQPAGPSGQPASPTGTSGIASSPSGDVTDTVVTSSGRGP